MKFCKNLFRVVELSDPEWGPYWMNYKFLKKKINDIVLEQGGRKMDTERNQEVKDPQQLSKSASEVEFFQVLKCELKKTSDFFGLSEQLYRIRHQRIQESYNLLKDCEVHTHAHAAFVHTFYIFKASTFRISNLL